MCYQWSLGWSHRFPCNHIRQGRKVNIWWCRGLSSNQCEILKWKVSFRHTGWTLMTRCLQIFRHQIDALISLPQYSISVKSHKIRWCTHYKLRKHYKKYRGILSFYWPNTLKHFSISSQRSRDHARSNESSFKHLPHGCASGLWNPKCSTRRGASWSTRWRVPWWPAWVGQRSVGSHRTWKPLQCTTITKTWLIASF